MSPSLKRGSAVPHSVPVPCQGKLCYRVGWTRMSSPWLETGTEMGWDGLLLLFPASPPPSPEAPGQAWAPREHSLIHCTSRLRSRRKLGADEVMRIPGARRLRLVARLGSPDPASPEPWPAEPDPPEPPGAWAALTHLWFWQERCCPR